MKNGTSSPADPDPSSSHFARVRSLFTRARELPPPERPAMVRASGESDSVIAEVLSLLQASDA